MNIILHNSYTESLVKAAKELPKPRAILVVSAHWLTNGTYVTCVEKPKTIFEMSLDYSPYNNWKPKSLEFHYKLASEPMPLREKGVLIIGSGNTVHNLGLIDFDIDATPFDWAVKFDEKVKQCLVSGNHRDLINYLELGNEALYAVPTMDHYLPMIYAIGLQKKGDNLKFIHEGFQNGSVSMRAFQIG